MGASEAVYRFMPSMRLKNSNVATVFVQTGFPEHRTVFYKKVLDDDANPDTDGVEEELPSDDIPEENFHDEEIPDLDIPDDTHPQESLPIEDLPKNDLTIENLSLDDENHNEVICEEGMEDMTPRQNPNTVRIKDKEGLYKAGNPIHERYIRLLCL